MKAKQQQNHYVEQHPPPSNSSTSYTSVDEEASSASSSSSESSSSIGVGVMKQQQQQQQNKQMPPVDLVLMSRLISEASSAYAAGQMAHSLALYDRLIEIDPKNNVLSANRSAILLKLGRIAEAIAEAETAIRLNPGWAKAHFRRGEALRELGRFDEALLSYANAFKLESGNDTYKTSFHCALRASSVKDKIAPEAMERRNKFYLLFSCIGEEFSRLGDHSRAIHFLELAMDCDDCTSEKVKFSLVGSLLRSFLALNEKGKAFFWAKSQLELAAKAEVSLDDQIALCETFLSSFQKNLEFLTTFKKRQLELHIKKGSGKDLLALLRLLLAEHYLTVGCPEEAEREFKCSLESDPTNSRALIGVGKASFQMGNTDIANTFFLRVERLSEDTPEVMLEAFFAKCRCTLQSADSHQKVLTGIDKMLGSVQRQRICYTNPALAAEYLGVVCHCYGASGESRKAKKFAKMLLHLGLEQNWPEKQAEALAWLFVVFFRLGNWQNAEKVEKKYFELADEVYNECQRRTEMHIKCTSLSGRLRSRLGDYNEALRQFKRRLQLLELRQQAKMKVKVVEQRGDATQQQKTALKDVEASVEAHSDLSKTYGRMKNLEKCRFHVDAEKGLIDCAKKAGAIDGGPSAGTLADQSRQILRLEVIHLEDLSELLIGQMQFEEAAQTLEQALMIVQELEMAQKEAKICEKLGYLQSKIGTEDDALVYFHQFLALSKHLRNVDDIFNAYESLASIHTRLGRSDEALTALRYQLTLAKLLGRSVEQQLQIIFGIGKILSKKGNDGGGEGETTKTALRLFNKARRLASESGMKRELCIVYGNLGELNLRLGDRQKAILCFSKQLPLFPFINDVEGKCETLQHLIEERRTFNDQTACVRLCRLRLEAVARGGGTEFLRIDVHRDSSRVYAHFGELDEAIQCLVQAFHLSVEQIGHNTEEILGELCDLYARNAQCLLAIDVIRDFLKHFREMTDASTMLLRLAELFIAESRPEEAIRQLLAKKSGAEEEEDPSSTKCYYSAESSTSLQQMESDPKVSYTLACAHFHLGECGKATDYMEKAERQLSLIQNNAPEDAKPSRVDNGGLRQKIALGRWLLRNSPPAEVIDLCMVVRRAGTCSAEDQFVDYLDMMNCYAELSVTAAEFLPHLALIHWTLWHRDYEQTTSLIALFGCGLREQCALEKLILGLFNGPPPPSTCKPAASVRQLASKSQQESRVDLLSPEWSRKVRGFHAFMAAISDWQTPLKALLQVEIFWRQESGRFKSNDLAYIRASLEEEMDMRTENTLVVQFRWSSHSLFWVKEPKCHHFRMFHLVDEEATPEEEAKRTSSFNDRILERIFDEELVGIAETEVNILRRYVRALALNSTGITLVGDVDLFRDENDGGQNNELLLLQGGKQCEMLATLVQLRMDEHQTQQQQSLHDRLIWMDDKLLVATTGEEEKEMEEYSESKNSIDEKVQQSASSSSIESIRSYKIVYLEDGHLAALTPGHLRQYRIAPELLVVLITESEEKDGCRRRESHLYRLALGALKTGTRLVVGIVVNCGGDEDQWRQSSTMTRRTVKLWSEEILAGKTEWTVAEFTRRLLVGEQLARTTLVVYGSLHQTSLNFAFNYEEICHDAPFQANNDLIPKFSTQSIAILRRSRKWKGRSQKWRRSERLLNAGAAARKSCCYMSDDEVSLFDGSDWEEMAKRNDNNGGGGGSAAGAQVLGIDLR